MSERSAHETQAADTYLADASRLAGYTDSVKRADPWIRAAFYAGIDWNEPRCRVCDTVECGTWYCRTCFKRVEFGSATEQEREEVLEGLLAACKEIASMDRYIFMHTPLVEAAEKLRQQACDMKAIAEAAIARADPQPPTEPTTDSPPERVPAECIPVSEFIAEELKARGWGMDALAERMGGGAVSNRCVLDILSHNDPIVHLTRQTAHKLALAFGTSVTLWLNLDAAWRAWKTAQPTKGGDCRQ